MSDIREYAIGDRGQFLHIFAAYLAITWSAYFEKNVRVFLTCLSGFDGKEMKVKKGGKEREGKWKGREGKKKIPPN